jgi:hypothetical protein
VRAGVVAVVLGALVAATPAEATTTIGQLPPATPSSFCSPGDDLLQKTVTGGPAYVVPPSSAPQVISAWSTSPGTTPGQVVGLMVYRQIGDPNTFRAVGHEGPHPLAVGQVDSFRANIPVQPGDVIGLQIDPSSALSNCLFTVPSEHYWFHTGNLSDGGFADFTEVSLNNYRLNLEAVVQPSNAFSLGALQRNKKKGTGMLVVNVSGPGEVGVGGKGVKAAGTPASGAGSVFVPIRAKGKLKGKLEAAGKVRLAVTVSFTPTGGDLAKVSDKVKLRKRVR